MASITARFDDALDRLAKRARGALLAAVADPATTKARAVLANAQTRWPVRTGRSRAGLALQETRGALTFQLAIVNNVGYALQVHHGESWRSLVADPMAALVRETYVESGRRILTALRGG